MEKNFVGSLRKLTRRVADLRDTSKTPSPRVTIVAMADAEEDFSSLPMPDRFQHKVTPTTPRLRPLQTANSSDKLGMEGSKGSIRRRSKGIRHHTRRT